MNQLRSKWIMSKNNIYVPSGLRAKSRFHQIFIVHKWGRRILENWDQLPPTAKSELEFVKQSESLIILMENFHHLIEKFTQIFKSKGIQKNSLKEWEEFVASYRKDKNLTDQEKTFLEKMNTYLQRQQECLPSSDQILCCSDVIESMFGKYKNKGGVKMITEDVLKIVAFPKDIKLSDAKKAMEKIKIADILKWKKSNTIVSKLALLKRNKNKSAA